MITFIVNVVYHSSTSASSCAHIWTGGKTNKPGAYGELIADWDWYYEPNGPSEPLTYIAWATGQPSYSSGGQDVIAISKSKDYDFNDLWLEYSGSNVCVLCEVP